MQDSFGRTLDYLRLSVTDRCNLRCRYCMPEDGVVPLNHQEVLSYEELLALASVAVRLGVRSIRVTGGEPLVRRGIVDFIRRLNALSPELEVTLTTNGLLLADMAAELHAAGLRRVNVSLDTLQPERFRAITRRDGLTTVLAGLEAADAVGLRPLKLNMVPILGVNSDEIVDFALLTRTRSWEVRFIEYMPISSGLDYPPSTRLPAEEIAVALDQLGPRVGVKTASGGGPARMYRIEGHAGLVGIIPAVSQHFCAECNRLRLTADGRIRPCLFSDTEIDLRTPLRAGASEDELVGLILSAASCKPASHRIGEDDFTHSGRRMHGIGG